MFTNNWSIRKVRLTVLLSTMLLAGCSNKMDTIIQKEVDKNENKPPSEERGVVDDELFTEGNNINGGDAIEPPVLSDEQEEMLKDSSSQTSEEAIQNNNLDIEVVIQNKVPKRQIKFLNMNEAAQYLSYQLFMYHSKSITSDNFYENIKTYFHTQFIDLIPKDETERKKMFHTLQNLFSTQLKAKIKKYETTKVDYNNFSKEAVFYRKYILNDGEEVFYKTTLLKGENNEWLLANDEPTVGYETQGAAFTNNFIKEDVE